LSILRRFHQAGQCCYCRQVNLRQSFNV